MARQRARKTFCPDCDAQLDPALAADDEGATAGSELKRAAVDQNEDAPDSAVGQEDDAQPPAKKARS